jgi:hypothetical protein
MDVPALNARILEGAIMAKFLLITRGGSMPTSPEEAAKVMEAWTAWFTRIGPAILDPGNPVSQVRTIAADGSVAPGNADSITGYTIVDAEHLDAAVALAKGAPLGAGMSIEVAETAAM